MTGRYIRHLTLNTGEQRDSYPDEVSEDALDILRPILRRAVAGERVPVPLGVHSIYRSRPDPGEQPGWMITAKQSRGRGLSLAIWGPPIPGSAVRIYHGKPPASPSDPTGDPIAVTSLRMPLATIGIAPVSLASREVWLSLTGRERDDMTPSAPYCAVRMQRNLLYPGAAHWLGDLQRCLAWAWVD